MKSYIVDVGKEKKVANGKGKVTLEKSFVLLTETGKLNETTGMPMYAINILRESQVVQLVQTTPGIETINFRTLDGKVKNKEGEASLERFNQEGFKVKPIVVLARVISEVDGVPIGYLYATNNGYTYLRKSHDFLSDCKALIRKAHETGAGKNGEVFKPIQNMKFIEDDKDEYEGCRVSLYNETNPIPVIVVAQRKNSYAKPSAENNIPKKATTKDMLKSIYTDDQLAELKEAKKRGVDIRIISNPKLSAKQMREIWTVEECGKPGRKYADPAYKVGYMKFLGMALLCGVNIDSVLNPLYDANQAIEILRGIQLGLDVNVYSDPKLTSEEMYRRRRDLELGIYGKGLILEGSGSKEKRIIKKL